MPSPPPRRLILAAATGYTWPQLAPFVRSLKATGYRGDFVMLVGRLSTPDRRAMCDAGIKLWRIRPLPHGLSPTTKNHFFNRCLDWLYTACPAICDALPVPRDLRRRIKARLGRCVHHIACSRYFYYYSYLRPRVGDYDEIMLTDVRDVIFQADPFTVPLTAPLRFFIEHPSMTVGGQINNALWVGNAYGHPVLAKIADRPVSCSGITYGTATGMLDYLAAMTDELTALTRKVAGGIGYDQGVHNYLIWHHRFPRAEIMENTAGPVLTLQAVPADEISVDSSGRLLDRNGAVVPVLHQYDRHPGHRDRLRSLLAG